MSHQFNNITRNTFRTPEAEHKFVNAPIGWDDIEQIIKRGRSSDGFMLSISQNQQFIKEELDFLRSQYYSKGGSLVCEQIRERKRGNDFEVITSDFVDPLTLEFTEKKATCDFSDSTFDKKFEDNKKEQFELDRETDVDGNTIPALERKRYIHRPRNIFLRIKFQTPDNYSEAVSKDQIGNYFFTPKVEVKESSDEDNTYVVLDGYKPVGGTNNQTAANVFHLDASKDKTLRLKITSAFTDVSTNIFRQFRLVRFNNGTTLDFVENIDLGGVTPNNTNLSLDVEIEVDLLQGESLAFGLAVTGAQTNTTLSCTMGETIIDQEEDSIFNPIDVAETNVDCLTIKGAFERWFQILDPTVIFDSTFIDDNWKDLVVFSGETMRHVLYDDVVAPLATVSFDDLFEALFTAQPCSYVLEEASGVKRFKIVPLDYVFDNTEEVIDLGQLDDIKITPNKDKIFSHVEIGYKKSSELEEVVGLRATHTVSRWSLPLNTADNTYKATTDFITDPTQIELIFRQQASLNPDRDNKYDKDIIMVDCSVTEVQGVDLYVSYYWDTHFTSVTNVYSPETFYNARLTPLNCLLRHGFNFKQEYIKPTYSTSSILFQNSEGDESIRTQLIGDVVRGGKDPILLSDLPRPLYKAEKIEAKGIYNDDLFISTTGGIGKKNYYKAVKWRDENGNEESAFLMDFTKNKGLTFKTELVEVA